VADITFVMAPRQNTFFTEIVEAVRDELRLAGIGSTVSTNGFPPARRGMVYALVPPHEWFALQGRVHPPTAGQLRRTIGICAEQPGTTFFEDDVEIAPRLGAVFDVSRASVRAFASRGIAPAHFPLGWTPSWSHVSYEGQNGGDGEPERDVDVLHLGIYSERREAILAESGRYLARWRCHLNLSDDHGPNFRPQPNYATGSAKWDLLRRSRTLLNIHVAERPYFEWQRVVQAVCNGCLVVSEHSTDHDPMEVGRHFVSARAETLGLFAHRYLEDEEERRRMARAAWQLLHDELPFRKSVERLVDAAEAVDRRPLTNGAPVPLRLQAPAADPGAEADGPDEFRAVVQFPHAASDPEASLLRQSTKAIQLELIELRRELARTQQEALAGGRTPRAKVEFESAAYRAARPRVSVLVSVYDYERHVGAALSSCATSRFQDVELVVVDDGSSDLSREAVRDWSAAHPGMPLLLIGHPHNRGLSAARNSALDFARGELSFILDADNTLYPGGLERLVAALDGDDGAAFAYGMLEQVRAGRSIGLRSYFPWRPARLRIGNYIDAMALWRTRALRELGGYSDDPRLYGWEDYDLWCHAAEHGLSGVLVPEIVARYRLTSHSMLAVANISSTAAVSLLVDRYPRTMGGLQPPP
jgi:glycosyl transferase family 2/glycosyl transferase family 1